MDKKLTSGQYVYEQKSGLLERMLNPSVHREGKYTLKLLQDSWTGCSFFFL